MARALEDRGTPGPLALVGSGEYLPEMAAVEAALLEGRPRRYVQLATAAVPDGPEAVRRWHRLGAAQADRLGVEAVILDVTTRADAEDPDVAAALAGAGLIYLSGGKPAYLAETLRSTPLWTAIVDAWRGGAALAGCSAGAMVMAAAIPSIRDPDAPPQPGLALLPHLRVVPHFDAFARRMPERLASLLSHRDPSVHLVGVDELTALVGGPEIWRVAGHGAAWLLGAGDASAPVRAGYGVRLAPGEPATLLGASVP